MTAEGRPETSDELVILKAEAYDIAAKVEQLQRELAGVNQKIVFLMMQGDPGKFLKEGRNHVE